MALGLTGIALLPGIHLVSINLVIPKGVAVVAGDHVRAGMHVASHALTRRNRARETVIQGMPFLVFRNRYIAALRHTCVAEERIRTGVQRIAIVCVDDMTRAAAARAVVAGMIVRAEEREMRIVETRLL